ncbi:MAG: hypothetical protein B7Y80_03375 [Hyphomicrobium sp. 32-62-53]|nr:MAG: hypothetical protein B7Z29_06895 [Hyphomicrobium sp. 12-62-95]OYY00966.1 MAG: hypothetical protein B7Y80_03375 [Hyphomicrobium sp. 32-62-53]
MLRRLAVTVLLFAPAAAAAEPMKLGASEIKDTFTGSRVELDTPLGTTIPVQFTDDGLMSGTAGSLASVLGAPKDRGRWWVKDDRLCTKWFRWFDAEEQCLTIHMKDERVFWRRADGKKGTATIVERPVVVAEPAKLPAARAEREPVKQTFATATLAAAPKPQARPPVLKAGPRLAARPKSAAEQLGLPPEAPADRSLFFVGMGLAHALRSQFAITSAEAAPVSKPKSKSKPPNAAQPSKDLVTAAVVAKPQASPANTSPAPVAAARQEAEAAPTALNSFRVYGVADDDVLNVRSGPSEGHAVVGNIPPTASTVRMVGGCIALWCKIQFRSTRGWVNRYYLAQN